MRGPLLPSHNNDDSESVLLGVIIICCICTDEYPRDYVLS